MIEAVSGSDLATYCADRIFAPLAMRDATFRPSDEQATRMMALHQRTPEGELIQQSIELAEPEFFMGGSGAYATAPDYLRFIRALLRGGELDGERVLGAETVELAFSEHLDGAPLPDALPSAMPELSNEVPALPFEQGWGAGAPSCSSRTSPGCAVAEAVTGAACSIATTGSTARPASPGSSSRRSCRSTTRRSSIQPPASRWASTPRSGRPGGVSRQESVARGA